MPPLAALLLLICWTRPAAAQQPGQAGPHLVAFRNVTFNNPSLATPNVNARVYYPATATAQNSPVVSGQWPIIAFGHGFNIGYLEYSQLLTHLASWGFYVITPDVQNGFGTNHQEFARELAASIQFILAEGSNASSPFFGNVGTKKGCFGHSMGGGATFLVPGVYADIDAVSGLAAAETNPSAITALGSVSIPVQLIAASQDNTAPPNTNQLPMFNAATGPKQYLSLTGGGHCKFTDGTTICDLASAAGSLSRANQIAYSKKYLTAFFQFFLKQDYSMRPWICTDSVAADVAANRLTHQTNIVCPNCSNFPLAITPSGPVQLCPGQSATLTATSGYSDYAWSDGQTGTSRSVNAAFSGLTVTAKNHTAYCNLSSAPVDVVAAAAPSPSITGAPAGNSLCAGSSATLGLSQSYSSYAWTRDGQAAGSSTTLTASQPGTYEVTVTNAAGCSGTASLTLSSGLSLSPTITGAPVGNTLCGISGGVTLGLSQGYSSYAWTRDGQAAGSSATLTASQPGTYEVTVTNAAGCSGTASLTLSSGLSTPPTLTPNVPAGQSLTSCPGQTLLLEVQTESGAMVEWLRDGQPVGNPSTNGQINASQAGTYQAVRSLGGCTDTSAAITVVAGSVPPHSIAPSGSLTICPNEPVTLAAQAQSGSLLPDSSYAWQPLGLSSVLGIGPTLVTSVSGSYQLRIRHQGCETVITGPTISRHPTPAAVTIQQSGQTLEASPAGTAHQWSRDGDTIAGATSATYAPTVSGTYRVTVTDANGCTVQSADFVFTLTGLGAQPETFTGWRVGPNPSVGALTLYLPSAQAQPVALHLTDALGRNVWQGTLPAGELSWAIDLPKLPAGLYHLHAQQAGQRHALPVQLQR